MTEYSAGLMFNDDGDKVVLRRKPNHSVLTALSGKIEPNETPEAAMVREFIALAGVEYKGWNKFCVLNGPIKLKMDEFGGTESEPLFRVHFFRAFDEPSFRQASTIEQETIHHVPVFDIKAGSYSISVPLHWLIPMASVNPDVVVTVNGVPA